MQVSVVTNTEPKNVSIPAAMAVGGAMGLAVRQFKPVLKSEMDSVLFGESDVIRQNNIKRARKNAIDDVVKMFVKDRDNEALKLFLERTKASVKYANAQETGNVQLKKEAVMLARAAKEKIKAAPENVRNEIKTLTQKVINKVRAARNLNENYIKTSVKQMRPYTAYILPGVALGAVCSFVYNVVGTISKDQ